MRQIKMTIGSVVLEAELLDTPTAEAVRKRFPGGSHVGHGLAPDISGISDIRKGNIMDRWLS